MMPTKTKKPWKKQAPARSKHTKLTPKSKKKAKAAAKRAGRSYPNLADNMNAAKKQRSRKKAAAKKTSGKKSGSKKK